MTDVKEQLRAYFDKVDPPFDTSGLMRDPQTAPVAHRSVVARGVLVAGAAAVVLVLVVGLPLLFFANRPQTSVEPLATTTAEAPTTTTEPTTTTASPDQVIVGPPEAPVDVFSWSADDISDWVTNDEITAVLADLSIEHAGTRLDGEAEFEFVEASGAFDEAVWTVGSVGGENHWAVNVHNGDHLPDDLWFSETDPKLPEGEITSSGFGFFAVRGPNSDELFCIGLGPPEEIFGSRVQEDIYVGMISTVASMMLEELGWVD